MLRKVENEGSIRCVFCKKSLIIGTNTVDIRRELWREPAEKILKSQKKEKACKRSETAYRLGFVAEMQGFEPWRRQSRPTGFRIRTLQPLGYISVTIIIYHRRWISASVKINGCSAKINGCSAKNRSIYINKGC